MPQWLRALDVLAENLGPVPSTHTVVHCLQLQFPGTQCPLLVSLGTEHVWYRDIHAGRIHTHMKINKSFKNTAQWKWNNGIHTLGM